MVLKGKRWEISLVENDLKNKSLIEYKIKHRENRLEEIKMENKLKSYKSNKTIEILHMHNSHS